MEDGVATPGWRAGWRTSTHSNNGGNCVEVNFTAAGVAMRDSKARGTGPTLRVTPTEWAAFVAGARNGEFD